MALCERLQRAERCRGKAGLAKPGATRTGRTVRTVGHHADPSDDSTRYTAHGLDIIRRVGQSDSGSGDRPTDEPACSRQNRLIFMNGAAGMLEITRVYDSADNAEKAVKRLKWEGFTDEWISHSSPHASERRWTVSIRPPFGMGRVATEIMDRFNPISSSTVYEREHSPGLELISRWSRWKSPGAISILSRSKSPGAISSLSRTRSPGAISRLSRSKPVGAIARLSASKSPGAISRLSKSPDSSSLRRLSDFYFSGVFGLPLLTRSQGPLEPDETLLTGKDQTWRRSGAR
jgi:hypothetical protein